MTNEEKAEDYDRLQYEFSQISQEIRSYKRKNKALQKQLDLHVVMHRRELLIAFFDSVDDADVDKQRNAEGWKVVDNYLKAINCA